MAKKFKLSKSSRANLDVNEDLIALVKRSLAKSPHDFGIPEDGGFRTPQEQNNLFHRRPKVTQLDGFKKISYHQSGKAFDIFIYDEHGACWECKFKYEEVKEVIFEEFKLMKEEGFFKDKELRWGGDWIRFKDLPHFELR